MVHDESNWLVSYADLMTLLFGFFILMYSLSRVDQDKFKIVSRELAQYFGGKVRDDKGATILVTEIEKLFVHSFVAQDIPAEEMAFSGSAKKETEGDKPYEVSQADGNILLKFKGSYLFNSGSSQLRPEVVGLMTSLAKKLYQTQRVDEVTVEGHTDDSPINSAVFPSNWELSAARASRLVREFETAGIDGKKLIAKGLGSSRPEKPNRDESGKVIAENQSANRRVIVAIKLRPEDKGLQPDLKAYVEPLKLEEVPTVERPAATAADTGAAIDGLTKEQVEARLKEAQDQLVTAQKELRAAEDERKKKEKLADLEAKIQEMARKTDEAKRKARELSAPPAVDTNANTNTNTNTNTNANANKNTNSKTLRKPGSSPVLDKK